MILEHDIVEANSNLMMADLEGEAVLLDVESGRYFGLNEVGTSIWALIGEPKSVSKIVETLKEEYQVSEQKLMEDVMTFLESMEARQLVYVVTPRHV